MDTHRVRGRRQSSISCFYFYSVESYPESKETREISTLKKITLLKNPHPEGTFLVKEWDYSSNIVNLPLWKVHSKILLTKYELKMENGKTIYRRGSTIWGWTPASQDYFVVAPVRTIGKKNRGDVEFLSKEAVWEYD